MSIAFDLGIRDLSAFYKYFYETHKQTRRAMWIVRFIYPVMLIAIPLMMGLDPCEDTMFFIISAIIGLAMGLLMPLWHKKRYLKRTKKNLLKPGNAIFLGQREMTFGEETVEIKTKNADEQIKWPAFIKWVEIPGYVFLYVAENAAQIIPLTQIAPEQAVELKTILNSYIKNN